MKIYINALMALFMDTWHIIKNAPQLLGDWLDGISERLNEGLNTDLGDGDYGGDEI